MSLFGDGRTGSVIDRARAFSTERRDVISARRLSTGSAMSRGLSCGPGSVAIQNWVGTRSDQIALRPVPGTVPWLGLKAAFFGPNRLVLVLGVAGMMLALKRRSPLCLAPVLYTAFLYVPFHNGTKHLVKLPFTYLFSAYLLIQTVKPWFSDRCQADRASLLAERSNFLITRAGLPATTHPSGTSRVTTLPAPTMLWMPIVTPGRMIAPAPIQAPSSIRTGLST